jgi:hypothetical protein
VLWVDEAVGFFTIANVLMIAFAALVIVTACPDDAQSVAR